MAENSFEIGIICIGLVSCFSSLAVILTYLVFQDLQRKLFMKFIFYISLSDFFLNISTSFGFPTDPALCYAQGVIAAIFSLASWLWTTVLSFTMFMLIVRGKLVCNFLLGQIFCWSCPLFCSLLPLAWGHYGAPTPREQWCVFIDNDPKNKVRIIFTFLMHWIWLFSSVILMLYWGVRVESIMRNHSEKASTMIKKCYNKIALYPLIMSVWWSMRFFVREFGTTSSMIAFFGTAIGASNGLCAAILFFVKNDEIRHRWKLLLSTGKYALEDSTVNNNNNTTGISTNILRADNLTSKIDDDIDIFEHRKTGTFDPGLELGLASECAPSARDTIGTTATATNSFWGSINSPFERHSEL